MLCVPFRPRRALEAMAGSKELADYLGGDYIRAYIECKEAELNKFEAIMSPAEFDWFLQSD